jgi:hypothetical protein
MYAIEFEVDIKGEFIRIPEFEKLKNRHVKVIVLTEESTEAISEGKDQMLVLQRRPAKVPPVVFKGDVVDTVPASDWDLT